MPGKTDDPEEHNGSSGVDPDVLTETLYGELRKLAASRMAGEQGLQTLQPTALVHEAWLRMGGDKQPAWASRAQFFASAAKVMRRILVERARRRETIRHGGGQDRVDLDAYNWERIDAATAVANDTSLLALNEALTKLASIDSESADLVEMHYFAGVKVAEASEALNLSVRTTERRLNYARAWLSQEVERAGNG